MGKAQSHSSKDGSEAPTAPPPSDPTAPELNQPDVAKLPPPDESPAPPVMSPGEAHDLKRRIHRLLTPAQLVPMPTATGMLIMGGANLEEARCHFPLAEYCIIVGTLSLSMIVFGVFTRQLKRINIRIGRFPNPPFRRVVNWMFSDNVLTKGEKTIIDALDIFNKIVSFAQVFMLFVGAMFILSHMADWDYNDKTKTNYCNIGIMLFAR